MKRRPRAGHAEEIPRSGRTSGGEGLVKGVESCTEKSWHEFSLWSVDSWIWCTGGVLGSVER